MDNQYKEELQEAGADVKGTLERFLGNENMYEKFLFKFLDDANFQGLKKGIEESNLKTAFMHAHTLKGIASNLGLDCLTNEAKIIVDELRNADESTDFTMAAEHFAILEKHYEKLYGIIASRK